VFGVCHFDGDDLLVQLGGVGWGPCREGGVEAIAR